MASVSGCICRSTQTTTTSTPSRLARWAARFPCPCGDLSALQVQEFLQIPILSQNKDRLIR